MRRIVWICLLLVALTWCGGCQPEKVYYHYNPTPVAGWEKAQKLTFDVPPIASGGRYATDLGLRTTSDYPFTSITMVVSQKATRSGKQRVDTVKCVLMDKKGNRRGKGVSYYQYRTHVAQMVLSDSDSLHITVHHNMKRDILPGIADVGIAVSRMN